MIAALLNVPQTPLEWEQWATSHAINHAAIIKAIADQGGPTLIQHQMYPVLRERFPDFLERNQRSHLEINNILGISSIDFQNVDVEDEQQLIAWIRVHHQAHADICQRLGIDV